MKQALTIGLLALFILSVGCGTSQPTNVIENADKAKLAEYEAMVAADSAAMSSSMQESPDGTAAPAEAAKK